MIKRVVVAAVASAIVALPLASSPASAAPERSGHDGPGAGIARIIDWE
jgi:hypothetical protein